MSNACLVGKHKKASALIMVISLLVLITTIAITFLELVGLRHNSTIGVAAKVKSEIALQQAQAHLMRCFNESAAAPKGHDGTARKYSSRLTQQWLREFSPITDPDGNPWTYAEDFSIGDANRGDPMPIGTLSIGVASDTKVSSNPLVNTKVRLYELMDISLLQLNESYRRLSGTFGNPTLRADGQSIDAADQYYFSRWHNIEYLDSSFRSINIDDSLTLAEKIKLRRTARYVLRYTAQAIDLSAMPSINNNFPHEYAAMTRGDPDSDHYIRYQNYLRCYGRSIKSMYTRLVTRNMAQHRPSNHFDPLDRETVAVNLETNAHGNKKHRFKTDGINNDLRMKIERAFRDGDLQWGDGDSSRVLRPGHKGRVETWSHLRSVYLGKSGGRMWDTDHFAFTPWGSGMLDAELGGTDTTSTPWKVNFLSATPSTMKAMVWGLHRHMQFGGSHANGGTANFVNSNYETLANNMTNNYNSPAPTNLLGRNYPEAFPLALDSGRNVPVLGVGTHNTPDTDTDGFGRIGGSSSKAALLAGGHSIVGRIGTHMSYVGDIMVAINYASDNARTLWGQEIDLPTGNEVTAGHWGAFRYRGNRNQSFLKAASSSLEPDDMMKQVLYEIYRILGEAVDSSPGTYQAFTLGTQAGADGITPYVSKGSYDKNGTKDANGKTLLEGGRTLVGAGSYTGNAAADWEISAQLGAYDDTRAMEYVLNDIMISLFGKANPEYVEGVSSLQDIAVDFNGDNYAESTVTGWWDYKTNKRMWSWWSDGLGPYVTLNTGEEYMQYGRWYRFDGTDIFYQVEGSEGWVAIPNRSAFLDYNNIWLTGNMSFPIKPFAKTGRFYIGSSNLMNGFMRGEVYDIKEGKPLAISDRYFVYRMDPNNDGDFSDNHILIQTDDLMEED